MHWLDYRAKLGIGFNDEAKKDYFIVKMFNVLDDISNTLNGCIDENEYYNFCNTTGTEMLHGDLYGHEYDCIKDVLKDNDENLETFLSYYVAFINCLNDENHPEWSRKGFKNIVCNFLEQSQIPYELLEDKDGYFIFPKGAKELDDALVSAPLEWLNEYPQTKKEWIDALKDYSNLTDDNASDVADKFRKALERFFQEFFNSAKSLENMKSEYGAYMKANGVPAEISNNLETLLQSYTNFMNGYAKHHNKTSKNVLEYIMYQTGNIIRLMITLKKEENHA